MLSEWFFEFLDVFLQIIRGDPRPFGGTQLVLCGDFFQMPPVDEARLEHLSHTHTHSLSSILCATVVVRRCCGQAQREK